MGKNQCWKKLGIAKQQTKQQNSSYNKESQVSRQSHLTKETCKH